MLKRMWVRFRFDISWFGIFMAWCYAITLQSRKSAEQTALNTWGHADNCLITLSVRSAWDLLLRTLQLPQGSEVLMTALTVPDMIEIVKLHGLVPVPVDINTQGEIILQSLEKNISLNTRIFVVAHLFGNQTDLSAVAKILKKQNILLVEDCAQSFRAVGETGTTAADIIMHSFGPIKTATALGGAIFRIQDATLHTKMQDILRQDPIQTTFSWLKRLFRFTLLKSLTTGIFSQICFSLLDILQIDWDKHVNSLAKSFTPQKLLRQIRQQPCVPLLRLLTWRWKNYDLSRIEKRIQLGKQLDSLLGVTHSQQHTYWVYPIFVACASALAKQLKSQGFDATTHSRMAVVPATQDFQPATTVEQFWPNVIFLPWYVELSTNSLDQMSRKIQEHRKQ